MKNLFNKLVLTNLLFIALLFTSCQEEFEEVGGDTQETIAANSNTAVLIENTATNDGSFDNIVDGASCLAIKFPYTVEVNGIQITIDSREDLHIIEEIFDEIDTDDDILDIIFPITITLGDFSELVIEDFEQLRELAAQCTEGGDDDDIECIDFVYPITLFTFDINEQQTGEVTVSSDMELRRFFAGLEDDELVSIQFPLTLKKFDGTEIVVDSNAELAAALERAKDECDEDDDDDFNDDDFTKERLDHLLVECPWEIREVIRMSMDQTGQYLENTLTFAENGSVTYQSPTGGMVTGEWSTRVTDNGIALNLEFEQLTDFTLEWIVYEIGDHKIKLYSDDGNKIVLRQHCPDDGNGDDGNGGNGIISVETLTNALLECDWIIKKVTNQGEEIERLLGYEFIFVEDGTLTIGNGITSFSGNWEIVSNDDNVRTLKINIGDEAAVSFDWPLTEIDGPSIVGTTRLVFKDENADYKMVLEKVCNDNADDNDVAEIRNIALGGGWNVASYVKDGMDMTADFNDMDFNFSNMHQLEVSVNDVPIAVGLWRVLRDTDEELKFFINLEENATLAELTDAWYIVSVESNRIELAYEDEEATETLVFEKP
ncbi:hypothetical protein [Flagellimonas meridianipacifica]|uniref:Lipocalin-like protein n=1 Tax=Flagellimonas meridianipacifica TaxID=1080225 RepID=A0A2T0M878_9FLAO|nr:hypothetical protein [Allomuricauda pacifica]PRX53746.1 hypothetical protein CLV81_2133 [Allomuricauda pacifica]